MKTWHGRQISFGVLILGICSFQLSNIADRDSWAECPKCIIHDSTTVQSAALYSGSLPQTSETLLEYKKKKKTANVVNRVQCHTMRDIKEKSTFTQIGPRRWIVIIPLHIHVYLTFLNSLIFLFVGNHMKTTHMY